MITFSKICFEYFEKPFVVVFRFLKTSRSVFLVESIFSFWAALFKGNRRSLKLSEGKILISKVNERKMNLKIGEGKILISKVKMNLKKDKEKILIAKVSERKLI
jgi:hypothetical protein